MLENLLKSYQCAKDDIDRWYRKVCRDKEEYQKEDAIECIGCIGKAYMLAQILAYDFNAASNVIRYIHDNHLDVSENMEKEFVVNSLPFREFAERGMEKEYEKYMGYSLYCID